MPLPSPPALSAEKTLQSLEALPAVQPTAANLSKYREALRPLARLRDSWLGVLAPRATQTASDAFYALGRVTTLRLPEETDRGQMKSTLCLWDSRFIFAHFIDGANTSPSPQLVIVAPLPRPFPDCPIQETNVSPCDGCDHWAHCATGTFPFAAMYRITINAFHFKMTCGGGRNGQGPWAARGASVPSISFRYTDIPHTDLLTGSALQAVPQFHFLFS